MPPIMTSKETSLVASDIVINSISSKAVSAVMNVVNNSNLAVSEPESEPPSTRVMRIESPKDSGGVVKVGFRRKQKASGQPVKQSPITTTVAPTGSEISSIDNQNGAEVSTANVHSPPSSSKNPVLEDNAVREASLDKDVITDIESKAGKDLKLSTPENDIVERTLASSGEKISTAETPTDNSSSSKIFGSLVPLDGAVITVRPSTSFELSTTAPPPRSAQTPTVPLPSVISEASNPKREDPPGGVVKIGFRKKQNGSASSSSSLHPVVERNNAPVEVPVDSESTSSGVSPKKDSDLAVRKPPSSSPSRAQEGIAMRPSIYFESSSSKSVENVGNGARLVTSTSSKPSTSTAPSSSSSSSSSSVPLSPSSSSSSLYQSCNATKEELLAADNSLTVLSICPLCSKRKNRCLVGEHSSSSLHGGFPIFASSKLISLQIIFC